MSAQSASVAAAAAVSMATHGNSTLSVVNGSNAGAFTSSEPKFGGTAAGVVGAGSQLLRRHISNASAHSGSALNGSHNHSYQQQQQSQPGDETDYSDPPRPVATKNLSNLKQQQQHSDQSSASSSASSTMNTKLPVVSIPSASVQNTPQAQQAPAPPPPPPPPNQHKFVVVTLQSVERCEYCCAIMYGVCRQAVKCKNKACQYVCHPKCLQYLPTDCPININKKLEIKSVNFARGIGTLMAGNLKVPRPGGVKKGWQDHVVYLSNARLFVYPIAGDAKPATLVPVQIIDIRDPHFSVNAVSESDVIHASKRDVPCILKMTVSKLRHPSVCGQPLLFCAKDEKERNNWINVLRDLNERLMQAAKLQGSSTSSAASGASSSTTAGGGGGVGVGGGLLVTLPIEAKEICDASCIRNAVSACVYDSERLLIASDDGIDVIDIKTDCTIQRFHDKKTFQVDVMREEKLIVAISGKNHQVHLFPTIVIEGINAEVCKMDDTKNCSLFCLGKLVLDTPQQPAAPPSPTMNAGDYSLASLQSSSSSSIYAKCTRLLCVAVKRVISVYEINSAAKPKYRKLRDIELPMLVQSMQIINNQLCVGFQSEFTLYSLAQEDAPIALLQTDRDDSLRFISKDQINALMAVQITSEEYLLVFENLGIYVDLQGRRSRFEEIMWPSKPLHVAYNEPYLLCFSDRGIDVFHVKTGEWIQIMQFPKTKPLDRTGALCLCNESADNTRLIHLKAVGEEEVISLVTKNRSLMRSKYRKGSLNKADETYLSLLNQSSVTNHTSSSVGAQPSSAVATGSTALNYSNSTASSGTAVSQQAPYVASGASSGGGGGSSRKSLISNPINFQHLQHMGPNDGKSLLVNHHHAVMQAPLSHNPSMTGSAPAPRLAANMTSTLNNTTSTSMSDSNPSINNSAGPNSKKATSSSSGGGQADRQGVKQIGKLEISGPSNFRHIVRGLNDLSTTSAVLPPATAVSNGNSFNTSKTVPSLSMANSSSRSMSVNSNNSNNNFNKSTSSSRVATSNGGGGGPSSPTKTMTTATATAAKSSSLSSSSSSSSILHSPNSPTTSTTAAGPGANNDPVNNTLKASSVLYNDALLVHNQHQHQQHQVSPSRSNSINHHHSQLPNIQINSAAACKGGSNSNSSKDSSSTETTSNSCYDNVSYFKYSQDNEFEQAPAAAAE